VCGGSGVHLPGEHCHSRECSLVSIDRNTEGGGAGRDGQGWRVTVVGAGSSLCKARREAGRGGIGWPSAPLRLPRFPVRACIADRM
jgi:hypothetical protein